jgi:hypothetical protein
MQTPLHCKRNVVCEYSKKKPSPKFKSVVMAMSTSATDKSTTRCLQTKNEPFEVRGSLQCHGCTNTKERKETDTRQAIQITKNKERARHKGAGGALAFSVRSSDGFATCRCPGEYAQPSAFDCGKCRWDAEEFLQSDICAGSSADHGPLASSVARARTPAAA